jgi:hypothetical protein
MLVYSMVLGLDTMQQEQPPNTMEYTTTCILDI